MANPSLQIGNSNWAIKEDNLLGYSTAGTRFVPQPITMTRASAGTRVNSSGLVETVELLGSEEVVNGDFATDSNWSTPSGWEIIDGKLQGTNLSAVSTTQGGYVFVNKTFEVTYTLSDYVQGEVRIYLGGSQPTINRSANGTYTEIISISASANTTIYIQGISNFTGNIDNISVKEYTANNLARVDYDGTASSLLVEPERTNNLTASQDLTDSFWNSSTRLETVVASTVLSPDGTTFGFKAIPTTNNSTKYLDYDYGFLSMPSSSEATYSIFVKPFGYTNFQIATSSGFSSRYQNFELTGDGIIGTGDVNGATIDKVGEWYRCSITQTTTGTTPRVLSIPTPSSGLGRNPTFTGNGTDGVLLWGASLEVGSYPTSYIPNLSTTSGSTVTRVQDQYSKTGISNLIGQNEGTLFVDVDFDTLSGLNMFLSIRPNSSNKIEIYRSSDIIYGEIASTNSFSFSKIDVTVGRYKIAVAYSSGSSAMYINGVLMSSNSTSFAFTSTLNDLYVGSRGGTSFIEQAKYNHIKLYKTRLSNSELATLTT